MLVNTNILKGILKEHGSKEFLNRLNNLYNLNLPVSLIKKEAKIRFTNTKIIIFTTDESFVLEFFEDYYLFEKVYPNYQTNIYYNNDKECCRKSSLFKTTDDSIIAFDEVDDKTIISRRFLKTSLEDKDLISGSYEKEILKIPSYAVTENFFYRQLDGRYIDYQKVITMSQNIYYNSYHTLQNYPSFPLGNSHIELSSSINVPRLPFYGRNRIKSSLFMETINRNIPNILISGMLTELPNQFGILFDIKIFKRKYAFIISIGLTSLGSMKTEDNNYLLPSEDANIITASDIDNIIKSLANIIPDSLFLIVIKELLKLKKSIKIFNYKELKVVDNIDYLLDSPEDFEHLSFNIYEHLKDYEKTINQKTTSNGPKLIQKNYPNNQIPPI